MTGDERVEYLLLRNIKHELEVLKNYITYLLNEESD